MLANRIALVGWKPGVVSMFPQPGEQPLVLKQQAKQAVEQRDVARGARIRDCRERRAAQDGFEGQIAVERPDRATTQGQAGSRRSQVIEVAEYDLEAHAAEWLAQQVLRVRHLGEIFELARVGHQTQSSSPR